MLANSVSPPAGGTSRASSMLAIGGTSRYAVSECQTPPKLIRSCSSFTTGMMSGYSSSPFTKGYSMVSPKSPGQGSSAEGAGDGMDADAAHGADLIMSGMRQPAGRDDGGPA